VRPVIPCQELPLSERTRSRVADSLISRFSSMESGSPAKSHAARYSAACTRLRAPSLLKMIETDRHLPFARQSAETSGPDGWDRWGALRGGGSGRAWRRGPAQPPSRRGRSVLCPFGPLRIRHERRGEEMRSRRFRAHSKRRRAQLPERRRRCCFLADRHLARQGPRCLLQRGRCLPVARSSQRGLSPTFHAFWRSPSGAA
jgi:hypothetical protein